MIDAVNRYSHLSHPVKPTLFFEFHGTSDAGVREHAASVQEIAAEHGAGEFQWATTTEARTRLWQARHNTLYAARAMRPGGKSFVTDVCVPISRLAECILDTKQDLASSTAFAPLVGHVGDGNFHLNFVFDPDDPRQLAIGMPAQPRSWLPTSHPSAVTRTTKTCSPPPLAMAGIDPGAADSSLHDPDKDVIDTIGVSGMT